MNNTCQILCIGPPLEIETLESANDYITITDAGCQIDGGLRWNALRGFVSGVVPQHELNGMGVEIMLLPEIRLIEFPHIMSDKDDGDD